MSRALRENRRVVIVLEHLEPGGAERQAFLLARHLRERRTAAEIWGLGEAGRLSEACARAGIPCRALGLPIGGTRRERLGALRRLARALREARAEAIVPYAEIPNVACGAVFPWSGARACLWNQRDLGVGYVPGKLERLALGWATALVANSEATARFLRERAGEGREVRIVPNGVEIPEPREDRAAVRARLGVAPEAFVVTMVANVHPNKDHATLIEAWRRALPRWPRDAAPPGLWLAGRVHEAMRDLVRDASDPALAVRFLGVVEDVPALLRASDLGVLSSRREGFPNAVLESMAAGLAVVATDLPAVREALGPGCEPHLAPPGDAAALAERLLAAAADPAGRASRGAAGRARAASAFSVEAMGERMGALLAEALER